MNKLELHWKIIIAMILGLLYGLFASSVGWDEFTNNWIKPWGVIFVNLLKLIAVPLVFVSLVKGISSLSDISKLSRIGGKTIIFYLITTVISVTIGLFLVNMVDPGIGFEEDSVVQNQKINNGANTKITLAEDLKEDGPLQFLVDVVPTNIFYSASNNRNMLQIIFFAILFGISMVLLPDEKTLYVKGFFDGINEIVLKMVDLVILVSPYGVFALLAALVVDFGASANLFIALGKYSFTVVLGLFIMVFLIYPLIFSLFTKVNYLNFFKGISSAQMLAFSTSSSAATLPVTMERCEDHLGVSKEITSFVLPLGATINMDGTSLYQAIAAVFIAQVFNIDLDMSEQLTIVLTATLASIGAAAVPGAGMVMLVIVLGAINVPVEGLALIFGVDRILDMLRTVVNVTGDATVAIVVASSEGELSCIAQRK
tara:strand:- start:44449 stop:45729 length:1281 start_codon:yes stop_codon:yes gene_type:complete